jgi:hypothetical protein
MSCKHCPQDHTCRQGRGCLSQKPGFELVDTQELGEAKPALDTGAMRWVVAALIAFWLAAYYGWPAFVAMAKGAAS